MAAGDAGVAVVASNAHPCAQVHMCRRWVSAISFASGPIKNAMLTCVCVRRNKQYSPSTEVEMPVLVNKLPLKADDVLTVQKAEEDAGDE